MKIAENLLNKVLFSYPDKTERIVYLLLFLFPIAGMSVRHWITNIFNLLVIISLFTLSKPRTQLQKQEKIFLWICFFYFSMFIISSVANDWGRIQTYYLGTELRFLMVIPLYLLLRRYPDCSIWLLYGSILGGFILLAQAYYDVYYTDDQIAQGVYSKNIIGPFSVLIGFWLSYLLWHYKVSLKRLTIFIISFSIISAFITAGLSGSRGAYAGFIITGLACILFFSKPRWMIASLVLIIMSTYFSYHSSSIIKNGVDVAVKDFQLYIQADDHVNDKSSYTSTGVRLEMIRTSLILISNNPLIGIGPGNYSKYTQIIINNKTASPALASYRHPHNVFIDAIIAKGILGLISVLMLFYYPAIIYIKQYKVKKVTAVIGLIHIIAISVFSLTDHSVVLMNNYTSILLLGIVIFFSEHTRNRKKYSTSTT